MYDPTETTYENLLRIFFGRHDPTQVNGQGNDQGTQYRAGVYFHDEEQVGQLRLLPGLGVGSDSLVGDGVQNAEEQQIVSLFLT